MTIERFYDLLFEVSNEVRFTILQLMEEGPSNISRISKAFDISNQECNRHVSRLVDVELAERNSEGHYGLTEFGSLFLKPLQGQMFTSANQEYFNGHTLAQIPSEFARAPPTWGSSTGASSPRSSSRLPTSKGCP